MSFKVVPDSGTDGTPNGGREIWNDNFKEANRRLDAVVGGAGFTNVSGGVTLDLDATTASGGRIFHHTMTGDITSLSFGSVPNADENATEWVWVLQVDATGGYTLSGTPTVDWRDKSDGFNNLDLTAGALNTMLFRQVGSNVHAWLVDTGSVAESPLDFSFGGDESQYKTFDRDYELDLGNVRHRAPDGTAATGSLAYEVNGTSASGVTTVAANDVLTVIRSGSSAAAAVSIPWYLA